MNSNQAEQTAVAAVENDHRSITFLNMTGDLTITWDPSNDAKIKELVKSQMEAGVTFFTMRKVIVEAVQIRRKVGAKGVDSLTNLVIDDATFAKMVDGLDDKALAETLRSGTGRLAKRKGSQRELSTIARAKDADEVIKARQAVAVRKVVGG